MTVDLPDQLALSTEFVEVEIVHKILGRIADPTADFDGFIAFAGSPLDEPPGNFGDARWHAATWSTVGNRYALTVLVGPKLTGVNLAPGVWHVFVGLDGTAEVPILYAGTRTIR